MTALERKLAYDPATPYDVIFDIDDVISDSSHRVERYIRTPRSEGRTPDWEMFFSAQKLDRPHAPTVRLLDMLVLSDTCRVLLFTGRPEYTREPTVRWLREHTHLRSVVHPPERALACEPGRAVLWMRPDGDREDDHVLKPRWLEQAREMGYDPVLAFEDRRRIVDVYRRGGLLVAHMAEGEF